MSSTTTNLGLTKPAYADEADIAVLNGNMDLLDAAYGNINQSTMRPVPFAIAVSDWSAVTGGFSATFNSAYITTTSQEILTYDGSLVDYAKAHIIDEKKSGGGGIVFTTATKPTGTIMGMAYVFDNTDHNNPLDIQETVIPIANGGTGQSTLAGAQSVLGITALSEHIVPQTFTSCDNAYTNAIKGISFVRVSEGASDAPSQTGTWILLQSNNDANYGFQLAMQSNSNNVYFRTKFTGTWRAWSLLTNT